MPATTSGTTSGADAKRPANLSISQDLLREARDLGINLSRAAERGIALAVKEQRDALWLEENRAALESSNCHVDRHGLPLARHRRF